MFINKNIQFFFFFKTVPITSKAFNKSKRELAPSIDTKSAKNVKDINLYSLFYPNYSWRSDKLHSHHDMYVIFMFNMTPAQIISLLLDI